MAENSVMFLLLNASVVWFVVAALLMKLLRLKSLVLVIMIAPYVIGSTFRHVAGMPQLVGFYGTSMLYGALGIVFGILYVEYAQAKAYFKKVSKTSFLARGGIALSSLYLLSFFAQKIIFNNPVVKLALSWIDGGENAKQLLSQTDYDGALTAGTCAVAGVSVLAFNRYREYRTAIKSSEDQNQLEHK